MALTVNTNLAALDANRNLNATSKSLAMAEQRLAAGMFLFFFVFHFAVAWSELVRRRETAA